MTSFPYTLITIIELKMSLTLHTGPMFGGKTGALIDVYTSNPTGTAIAVKPSVDTRVGMKIISTHTGRWVPAVCIEKLCDVQLPVGTRIVCIDEGQFFPDLREGCIRLMDIGMDVHVAALNGTYAQQPWKSISEILPLVTDVHITKSAECGQCKTKGAGIYTWRKTACTSDVLIGGADHYMPVCPRCLQVLKAKH